MRCTDTVYPRRSARQTLERELRPPSHFGVGAVGRRRGQRRARAPRRGVGGRRRGAALAPRSTCAVGVGDERPPPIAARGAESSAAPLLPVAAAFAPVAAAPLPPAAAPTSGTLASAADSSSAD